MGGIYQDDTSQEFQRESLRECSMRYPDIKNPIERSGFIQKSVILYVLHHTDGFFSIGIQRWKAELNYETITIPCKGGKKQIRLGKLTQDA